MKPTKLQSLFKKANKMNYRNNGTVETFRNAIYEFGHECFIKALQGKLLEVKYDGKIVDVDIVEEMK